MTEDDYKTMRELEAIASDDILDSASVNAVDTTKELDTEAYYAVYFATLKMLLD